MACSSIMHCLFCLSGTKIREMKMEKRSDASEVSSTCGGGVGVALVLQGDQREVDTFPLQELTVGPSLHRLSVLKAHDHVCVPDGGEAVGDGNGGPARAHLHSLGVIEVFAFNRCSDVLARLSPCPGLPAPRPRSRCPRLTWPYPAAGSGVFGSGLGRSRSSASVLRSSGLHLLPPEFQISGR